MTNHQQPGKQRGQQPPAACSIAGVIYAHGEPITLACAEALRDAAVSAFMAVRDGIVAMPSARETAFPFMVDLSVTELDWRIAIHHATQWRKAAGWADPHAADTQAAHVAANKEAGI